MTAHFGWPLTPYLLVTFLRFASCETWSEFWTLNSYNSAELALTIGLIAEFAYQNISRAQLQLPDKDEEERKRRAALRMKTRSYVFFGLFIAVEIVRIAVLQKEFDGFYSLWIVLRIFVLLLALWTWIELNLIQGTFQLVAED